MNDAPTLFALPKAISERDKRRAVKLAVEGLRREIQRISVSANLHDVCGLEWASAAGASKRRAQMRWAIEILEAL